MNDIEIKEIKSGQAEAYKKFLTFGLINDEEHFRITPTDDLNAAFPTKDTLDSFSLGAYSSIELASVVSFTRDGGDREKLRHKGILFRMYVSKDFRRKGLATKLIEKLIERVKQIRHIEQINLTVIANNENAKKPYEKFGFVAFGSENDPIKWQGQYYTEDQLALKLK